MPLDDSVFARAVDDVRRAFPFAGYVDPARKGGALRLVAETVSAHVPAGGRILDFGAGPAEKTAVLARLGYRCTAVDDLSDFWHQRGDNRARILEFAERMAVRFLVGSVPHPELGGGYDAVLASDVIEHLHESPRVVLNPLVEALAPGGLLIVTVPNAVNLRKRLSVLAGRTNYPAFRSFFWYPGPWRGHVREYTTHDLRNLADLMGLATVRVGGGHTLLWKLSPPARLLYRTITALGDGLKDTLVLVARKPQGWARLEAMAPERVESLLADFSSYRGEAGGSESLTPP